MRVDTGIMRKWLVRGVMGGRLWCGCSSARAGVWAKLSEADRLTSLVVTEDGDSLLGKLWENVVIPPNVFNKPNDPNHSACQLRSRIF